MDLIKVKFHFASEAGADSKTTRVKVKTIQRLDQQEIFAFPGDKQTEVQHVQLFKNEIVKGVVRSLKVRNKFRKVTVTLSEELKSIYFDEEGNTIFGNEYLEEVPQISTSAQVESTEKSNRSKAKDMVLEKVDGENFKANTWLKLFIQECERVRITQANYAETLRLFLDKSALEWFSTCMKEQSLVNNWELWKNSFLETFSAQSWAEIAYAYNFKFLNGSLLEYALKKRNLLLEADEDMAVNTQINLIVINLPKFIQNKLEKKSLNNIEDLMSKLKQMGKFNEIKKETQKLLVTKTPCSFCEKLGYVNRFHPESLCRLKIQKINKQKNENIKIVNNTEIQEIIANSAEAKNA
ncbi:uncharacterized protein LOC143363438 [Halictus rubicundus]|uniref:uncharacterized protein LOC143363438 n=1 Tax=Halictus rubicundus TaxID=77578 RepID=UPI0040361A7F